MINQARGWLGGLSVNPVPWMAAENSILLIFLGQGLCHMIPYDLGSQGTPPHFLTLIPERFTQV